MVPFPEPVCHKSDSDSFFCLIVDVSSLREAILIGDSKKYNYSISNKDLSSKCVRKPSQLIPLDIILEVAEHI